MKRGRGPVLDHIISENIDQCIGINRNNQSIYLYWSASRETQTLLRNMFGLTWATCTKTLRLNEVTGISFNGHNAHQFKDYDVSSNQSSFFMDDLAQGAYIAEIGVTLPNDQYFALLRSNLVYVDSERSLTNEGWKQDEEPPPAWKETFSTYSCYLETNKVTSYDPH